MSKSTDRNCKIAAFATAILGLIYFSGPLSSAEEAKSKHEELTISEIMVGRTKHEHETSEVGKKYQGNEKAIKQGAELYHKFNCVGCHFDGGGGIGPALIDDEWIYGSSIDHIAATIRQGRPNGMPSFHAVLKEEEIWQLAAYIEDGLKEHPHGEKAAGHEHGATGEKADGEKGKQSKEAAPKQKEDGGAKDHHH
jgi:cytochrome c oxidase cbb3-type subunit 3